MEKTFALKLADRSSGGASKWTGRDAVSLAGCTHVGDGDYRLRDTGYYC